MSDLTSGSPLSIPHLSCPFVFDLANPTQPPVYVEQNTLAEVANCVGVLCSTPLNYRLDVPEFGIPNQTFGQGFDTSVVTAAVAEWEPRAAVTVTVTNPGRNEQVNVAVSLADTTTSTT